MEDKYSREFKEILVTRYHIRFSHLISFNASTCQESTKDAYEGIEISKIIKTFFLIQIQIHSPKFLSLWTGSCHSPCVISPATFPLRKFPRDITHTAMKLVQK